MVVSVVTRGVSDDCNSFVVDGASVWLRVARVGSAFAFHASTDGSNWSFIRHFALETAARRRSGSPHSPRRAKAVASRSSRSRTRRHGSATCAAASER